MLRCLGACALVSLAACTAGAPPPLSAPLSPDTGAVSMGHFTLSGGGRLSYLSLSPATWGRHERPRFRAYVLPGSGCNGLAPIARAYFRGLSAGEVVVPHKRHVDASRWRGPDASCSLDFVQQDRLDQWASDAKAFVAWHLHQYPLEADQSVALVGISEGAELLPSVAANQPEVALLVLVGSTGLDPLESLQLQALRQGAPDFVDKLSQQAADTTKADDAVWAGRSMGYWRTLLQWRYSQALLEARQTVWLGFGTEDKAVPLEGLKRFQARAQAQERALCLAVFQGADHGLQRQGSDGPLQQYWAAVADTLSRKSEVPNCVSWTWP